MRHQHSKQAIVGEQKGQDATSNSLAPHRLQSPQKPNQCSRWKWPTIIQQEWQPISFNNDVKINHAEPRTDVIDNKRCLHCICVRHFHMNLWATCHNNTRTVADTEAVLQAMREMSLTEQGNTDRDHDSRTLSEEHLSKGWSIWYYKRKL